MHLEVEIEEKNLDGLVIDLRSKFGDIIRNIEVVTVTKHLKYTYLTQQ